MPAPRHEPAVRPGRELVDGIGGLDGGSVWAPELALAERVGLDRGSLSHRELVERLGPRLAALWHELSVSVEN